MHFLYSSANTILLLKNVSALAGHRVNNSLTLHYTYYRQTSATIYQSIKAQQRFEDHNSPDGQ